MPNSSKIICDRVSRGDDVSHFIEVATLVIVGALFILYVDFPSDNAPIERHWLDEATVCYKQAERIINCETVGVWE